MWNWMKREVGHTRRLWLFVAILSVAIGVVLILSDQNQIQIQLASERIAALNKQIKESDAMLERFHHRKTESITWYRDRLPIGGSVSSFIDELATIANHYHVSITSVTFASSNSVLAGLFSQQATIELTGAESQLILTAYGLEHGTRLLTLDSVTFTNGNSSGNPPQMQISLHLFNR